MQIIASLSSDKVLATASEPSTGGTTLVNGKYVLPTPEGVSVDVPPAAYLTPQDSGSLPVQIADGFLERNPMYDNREFNFFLEATDVAKLDLGTSVPGPTSSNVQAGTAPTWGPGSFARCQVGRGIGPAPTGTAPGAVALLPINSTIGLGGQRYGAVITDTIDITSHNPSNPGTDEVMVWWKFATYTTSEDVVTGYGATSGQNTPVRKDLVEGAATPPNVRAYASVDDGVSWYEVNLLEPADLVTAGTDLRLAFVNEGTTKVYLLGYIVLFPNLP